MTTDHLGCDRRDVVGKNAGNSPRRQRSKTVLTDVEPVEVAVRRDRDGSFEHRSAAAAPSPDAGSREMVCLASAP